MTWMAWTPQTALFFTCIGVGLVSMTILELLRPTSLIKGFLPMPTTRGDRFFISLLSAAFIHLLWLGSFEDYLYVGSTLSVIWAALLMRWG